MFSAATTSQPIGMLPNIVAAQHINARRYSVMSSQKKKEPSWGKPGAYALARNQAGGDWAAGVLLYRIKWRWATMGKKLHRFGKDWVAMSRANWAKEAGLSEAEMKNRALPILRKRQFIKIRQMKITPTQPKLLWVTLDLGLLHEWTEPEEIHDHLLNGGTMIGHYPPPTYPYKASSEEN